MTTTEPSAPVRPSRRNALTTWLIPMVCFVLAPPLGGLLGETPFRFAPTAAILAGIGITYLSLISMVRELNAVSGSALVAWHLFIPFYGIYWAAVLVPKEMAVAKQKAGKSAPRGLVVYLVLFLYAFATDLDDLAT